MPQNERSPAPGYLSLLREGEVEVHGRLPWSSNRTFLVTCGRHDRSLPAVYKPHRGERPLWDFPDGLYRREAAAYELSRALGWDIVPETVVRDDAPMGRGSLQRFVDADFEQHYFSLLEDPGHHDGLRVIAAFDLVANNADRKSGHCLLGEDGRIWAIDNGLCFHPEPKLRTVIWDFGGEPIPSRLLADLERVSCSVPPRLADLLGAEEREALGRRLAAVLKSRRYPDPSAHYRSYPWPLV